MLAYKLTHPEYLTDQEDDARNPVVSLAPYRLPGMECDVCGRWASSARLRVPFSEKLEDFREVRFLKVSEWRTQAPEWARLLDLDVALLLPGAKLGPPYGKCKGVIHEAVVHPTPGEVWVSGGIKDVLISAGFTGLGFARVELTGECGSATFWEILPRGRVSSLNPDGEAICGVCGRGASSVLGRPRGAFAEASQSDFFLINDNPNVIYVTERVAVFVREHQLPNLTLVSLDLTLERT